MQGPAPRLGQDTLAVLRESGASDEELAALQERSGSPVAVLGYSGTVAIGHILLTTWGTVIVKLLT